MFFESLNLNLTYQLPQTPKVAVSLHQNRLLQILYFAAEQVDRKLLFISRQYGAGRR